MDSYFVCHAGGQTPADPQGMIGRMYVWRGEWVRSPEDVAHRERNPTMKLYPLWGDQFLVEGDTGCFTRVFFENSPT